MDALLERAAALHARAVQQQNRYQAARALRTLARALHAAQSATGADAERLTTAILLSTAYNQAELQGAGEAFATVAVARRHAEAAHDDGLVVRSYSQEALIALRVGRLDVAFRAFRAAEPLLAAAADNDRFAVLLNLGTLRLFEGRPAQARPYLQRAAELARKTGLTDGEFKALHNLGYADFLAGDLPAALSGMAEALRLAWGPEVGVALLDRARVLLEAGLVRESDATLARAAEIFRADRASQDLAETVLERARCALVAGDAPAARRFAMQARDRFRRRGNDRWRRAAELVLLQGDLAAGRPGARLLPPALRLAAEFRRSRDAANARTAALLAAEAALATGRTDEAAAVLSRMGRASAREPITARLHAALVRARLDTARGRNTAAAARAQAALDDLGAYQAGFGSLDLATAAAVHGRRIARLAVTLALRTGRPNAVLEASERARAVTNRVLAVRPPEDPAVAQLLAELRQVIETLRRPDGASESTLRRRRSLESAILAHGWSRGGAGVLRDPAPVGDIVGSLGDRVLVSFVRSDDRLFAVVVSAAGLRLVPLSCLADIDERIRRLRADLDLLAAPLPQPVRAAVWATARRSLRFLDEQLIASLGVADAPLVLASTGLLGQLPWPLLPSLRSVPLVVAPSATAWLGACSEPPTARRRVLAVSGPGIRRGSDEARRVAAIWRGDCLDGPAATTAAVADALADGALVHVAAHGTHQGENPLFSSLRLADGDLFAHELHLKARAADHVVLSACELGLATVRPGDEALGLTSVLLRLGTRAVVAGVARVNDEVAAEVLVDYHRRLAAGSDSAHALAAAVAGRGAAADGFDVTPAPFVCFGSAWRA